MRAVISGRAGTALLLNGDSLQSFDVDDPDTLVPRRQSDLPFLFGDAGDLQFLENVDRGQVKNQLEKAYSSSTALDLMLILLDPGLSKEVRTRAAAALEKLFADFKVIESVEFILYAKPFPATADLAGALDCCYKSEAALTRSGLETLEKYQTPIREVSLAWELIPEAVFGGEQKTEFQRVAIREGLFHKLVMARGEPRQVRAFLENALANTSVNKLRNYREVMESWVELFRPSPHPPTTPLSIKPKRYQTAAPRELVITGALKRRQRSINSTVGRNLVFMDSIWIWLSTFVFISVLIIIQVRQPAQVDPPFGTLPPGGVMVKVFKGGAATIPDVLNISVMDIQFDGQSGSYKVSAVVSSPGSAPLVVREQAASNDVAYFYPAARAYKIKIISADAESAEFIVEQNNR